MIRILALAICIFSAGSCLSRGGKNQNAGADVSAGIASVASEAEEAIPDDSAARPPLVFRHEAWDFGTIAETGGAVEHTFRFTNHGPKPIVVVRVGVTCGCMKPAFSQAPVAPGGSGEIRIVYDPADRPGAFDKAIYVYVDGDRRMTLRIRGSVVPRPRTDADRFPAELGGGLRLSAKEVNFRMVEQRHERRLTLRCLNTSQAEMRLGAELAGAASYLRIETPARLASGAEGEIAFVCDLSGAEVWGSFADTCCLTLDDRRLAMPVLLRGTGIADLGELRNMPREKRPRAEIAETLLDFGTCDAGSAARCRFSLENKGRSPLRIHAVKLPQGMTARIAPGDEIAPGASKSYVLQVDGRQAGAGNYFAHVELLVNDALTPLMNIRVRGRFE